MSVLLLTMGPQLGITADLPVVAVGGAGVIRFRPIGASGPVKWTLVDSTLPAEWDSALNPDGNAVTLTTSDAETAGTFSVTVRAVDSARIPVVRSFDVRVMALPLTISGAFPEWSTGSPATGALTISGGVPPYSGLAITSGSLPSGVSLSIVGNQIVPSGAPTVVGPWSAIVQVSDAEAAFAQITLSGDVIDGWTPNNLFSNGERGLWIDPSDLSTLWQDAAGTIPVTATGQPVGRIADKSGNGHFLTQPSASKRPVLAHDGDNYYLSFDGSDDWLSAGTTNTLSLRTESAWACAGVRYNGLISMTLLARSLQAGMRGRYALISQINNAVLWSSTGTGPPELTPGVNVDANITADSTVIQTGICDRLTVNAIARVNGTATGTQNPLGAGYPTAPDIADQSDISLRFLFGAYNNPNDSGEVRFLNGRCYGAILVLSDPPTTEEVEQAEAWMAQKAGVVL